MATKLFNDFIEKKNLDINVEINETPTKTAEEAAIAQDVPVSNIVKSLLVKADERFVMFLVPGDKRIDFAFLKDKYGYKKVRMSTADEVKEITGHSIGGVPPFGHKNNIKTYIYPGFDETKELAAAAGAFNATFKITLDKLQSIITTL